MSDSKSLSLLIAEDHEFTRMGLVTAIRRKSDFEIVGEAENGKEAVSLTTAKHPDVVIMDIGMPEMDGITATRCIKENLPETKVIILTSRQIEEEVFASISAGADAYCMKDITTERLIQVLNLVSEGGIWLDPYIAKILSNNLAQKPRVESEDVLQKTRHAYNVDLTGREKDVLDLIVNGKSNKEIAAELNISIGTVKVHVSNIIQKLAVDDRTQVAIKALKEGLI